MISITLDPTADVAYMTLSDHNVVTTQELSPEVLVDLDGDGDIVGIELLRTEAEIPFGVLAGRYRVPAQLITLLCELVPTLRGRRSMTQGQDGEARQTRELVFA